MGGFYIMKNLFLSISALVALIVPTLSYSILAQMVRPNLRFALPVSRLTYSPFLGRMGLRQVGRCFSSEKGDKAGTSLNKADINLIRGLVGCAFKRGFNELNRAGSIALNEKIKMVSGVESKKKRDLNVKDYEFLSHPAIVAHLDEIDACNVNRVKIDKEQADIVSKAKKVDVGFNHQTNIDLLCLIIAGEGNRSVQNEIKRKRDAYNVEKTD